MILISRIPEVIITACCLHNFIIKSGQRIFNDDDGNDDVDEFNTDDEEDEELNNCPAGPIGREEKRKRTRIIRQINLI